MYCNVNLRKLLSAHKSHVRETSLFTGAIPNQVRNNQTSRFISLPGQNPGRSSRGAEKMTANEGLAISIDNKTVPQVKSAKFLGVYVDEHLTWNYHIAHISNK